MTFNLKTVLLAGTALVAVGFAAPAFAADEFLVDGNDSGTFTATGPDETANTALDWDAGTNGAGTAVASHDLRVDENGTITFSANATVGDATTTTAGIQAGVTGKTLTIDDNSTDDAANTATVTGGISVGSLAALSVTMTSCRSGRSNSLPQWIRVPSYYGGFAMEYSTASSSRWKASIPQRSNLKPAMKRSLKH